MRIQKIIKLASTIIAMIANSKIRSTKNTGGNYPRMRRSHAAIDSCWNCAKISFTICARKKSSHARASGTETRCLKFIMGPLTHDSSNYETINFKHSKRSHLP